MDLKNILNEGSSHHQDYLKQPFPGKWEKTGLLEGIDNEVEKAVPQPF